MKNLTYAYMGVGGGVKNCQNHAYVINEGAPIRTEILREQNFSLKEKLYLL